MIISIFTNQVIGKLGATAFYAVSSYWLLFAAGEVDLIADVDFLYWLAVTASTVGYGDLSPVTSAGKLVVARSSPATGAGEGKIIPSARPVSPPTPYGSRISQKPAGPAYTLRRVIPSE